MRQRTQTRQELKRGRSRRAATAGHLCANAGWSITVLKDDPRFVPPRMSPLGHEPALLPTGANGCCETAPHTGSAGRCRRSGPRPAWRRPSRYPAARDHGRQGSQRHRLANPRSRRCKRRSPLQVRDDPTPCAGEPSLICGIWHHQLQRTWQWSLAGQGRARHDHVGSTLVSGRGVVAGFLRHPSVRPTFAGIGRVSAWDYISRCYLGRSGH